VYEKLRECKKEELANYLCQYIGISPKFGSYENIREKIISNYL
jgi:hypothetical protein